MIFIEKMKSGVTMRVCELADNLDEYLVSLKDDELSDNTIKRYNTQIKKFIEYLRDDDELTKQRYIDFRTILTESKEINTVNQYIVAINKYLSYLHYDNLKIKQLRVQRRQSLDNVASVSDFKRLISRTNKFNDVETKLMMQCMAFTGNRVSELKFFTYESVKEAKKKNNTIFIKNKGKYRELTLPTWLIHDLLKYCQERKIKGLIFESKHNVGHVYNRSTINRRMKKYAGKCKVKLSVAHPHSLRHLYGKQMLKLSHGDYRETADFMGHFSEKTTRIYTQLSSKEKKDVANLLKYK